MSVAAEYASAVHPARWRVLPGVTLHPLTLGHAVILSALESPFSPDATGQEAPPGLGDLLAAILVCRHSPAGAVRAIERRRARVWLWLWAWIITVFGNSFQRISESRVAAAFAGYLRSAWTGPDLWQGKSSGQPAKAPFLLRLKLALMKAGKSEREALETPLAAALWDLAATLEARGDVEFVSDVDRKMIELARQGPPPEENATIATQG